MSGLADREPTIHPGCYRPDCDDEHAEGHRFCPRHGGAWTAHWDGKQVTRKKGK